MRVQRVVLFAILALLAFPAGSSSPARSFRVGLVLEPGGMGVAYDRLFVTGLRRAVRELGVGGKVLTPGPKEGYLPSFLALARQGYDLVIGWGGDQVVAIDEAARAYPHTRFAYLDSPVRHRRTNIWNVTFAEQEAGYLAGYLAGSMEELEPGKDVVSSVGGIEFPPVDHYIAGFEAGARNADRAVTTLHGYSQDFLDASKCRRVAADQIARGSQVVFNVAGACGLGALEAAKEKHVWGVGVDVDQSSLGPYILTSAVKRVDVAVYLTIRATLAGRFAGGRTTILGLRENVVGLGTISSKVPRTLIARVESVSRRIAAGTISVPTVVR
jgi:basic membrane protein A